MLFSFGPFQLDERSHALRLDGEAIAVSDRHAALLVLLVSNAGRVISKDALAAAGWGDVAVTDNSVEQAISSLRRALGPQPDGHQYIETVPRRGYRFAAEVRREVSRESDAALDALIAPHRAWLEGRAALETLERDQVMAAQLTFARVLEAAPDYAPAHVGMANACVLRFESTRADQQPDLAALAGALQHARDACRLDPASGEAWATLAFVVNRTGDPQPAVAAARRAVALEPGNWRHHLRLAFVSWGEARLRAAAETLRLLPGLALAHWLAATVHVARQAFDSAERELDAGAAAQDEQTAGSARFSAVGLHWLRGLVRLQRGDEPGARAAFERELSFERAGHLYARECCANTWYALGALHLRNHQPAQAIRAFDESLSRVNGHVLALAAKAALEGRRLPAEQDAASISIDAALPIVVWQVVQGERAAGAARLFEALGRTPPGSPGWIIPVEPVLQVAADPGIWAHLLAAVRTRAA